MIKVNEEIFLEIVEHAVAKHISRDTSICLEDQRSEDRHLAATLAETLQLYGLEMPAIARQL